jgi:hypothetical protein
MEPAAKPTGGRVSWGVDPNSKTDRVGLKLVVHLRTHNSETGRKRLVKHYQTKENAHSLWNPTCTQIRVKPQKDSAVGVLYCVNWRNNGTKWKYRGAALDSLSNRVGTEDILANHCDADSIDNHVVVQ